MKQSAKQKKYNAIREKNKIETYKKIQAYCKKENAKNIRPGVIIQTAMDKFKVSYVTVYRAINFKLK